VLELHLGSLTQKNVGSWRLEGHLSVSLPVIYVRLALLLEPFFLLIVRNKKLYILLHLKCTSGTRKWNLVHCGFAYAAKSECKWAVVNAGRGFPYCACALRCSAPTLPHLSTPLLYDLSLYFYPHSTRITFPFNIHYMYSHSCVKKRKFWEELITYFPLIWHVPRRKRKSRGVHRYRHGRMDGTKETVTWFLKRPLICQNE
jgi:hypothetical protein